MQLDCLGAMDTAVQHAPMRESRHRRAVTLALGEWCDQVVASGDDLSSLIGEPTKVKDHAWYRTERNGAHTANLVGKEQYPFCFSQSGHPQAIANALSFSCFAFLVCLDVFEFGFSVFVVAFICWLSSLHY